MLYATLSLMGRAGLSRSCNGAAFLCALNNGWVSNWQGVGRWYDSLCIQRSATSCRSSLNFRCLTLPLSSLSPKTVSSGWNVRQVKRHNIPELSRSSIGGMVRQSNNCGTKPLTFSVSIRVVHMPAKGSWPLANSHITIPTLYISDFSL